MGAHDEAGPATGNSPDPQDATEACALLADQTALLLEVYDAATEPPARQTPAADLCHFLLRHGLHVWAMGNSALTLMDSKDAYPIPLLARSALESAFYLVAAAADRSFGPQRMAFEMEELGRKLRQLIKLGAWTLTRHPTPEECAQAARGIRGRYGVAPPGDRAGENRISNIEQVARAAGLSPYYDDDYRWLSLFTHGNQAGIENSISGFLPKKAMQALCSASSVAGACLSKAFGVYERFSARLDEHHARVQAFLRVQDLLPVIRPGTGTTAGPPAGSHGARSP